MQHDSQVPDRRWVCIAAAMLLPACWSACAAANDAPPDNRSSMNAAVRSLLPALLDDAARRSGLAPALLRVVDVEAVVWRDGALGCPQPGMSYPQMLVPGWLVRIAAGTKGAAPLQYHLSGRGGWLYCPKERAQSPLPRDADPRI